MALGFVIPGFRKQVCLRCLGNKASSFVSWWDAADMVLRPKLRILLAAPACRFFQGGPLNNVSM
jgi:hypothetical protein